MESSVDKYVRLGLLLLLFAATLFVATWLYYLHCDRKPLSHPYERTIRLSRGEEGWQLLIYSTPTVDTPESLSGYLNELVKDNSNATKKNTGYLFLSEKAYPDTQDRLQLLPKTDINRCWYHTRKYDRDVQLPRPWWGRECPDELYVKVDRTWRAAN